MRTYIRTRSQDVPAGPDGFRRKVPNLNSGLEVREMSQACPCAVQPVLPSFSITCATVDGIKGLKLDYCDGAASYVRPCASSAQIVRAILFASATATTFVGRRDSIWRKRSGKCFELEMTDRAPWISSVRR